MRWRRVRILLLSVASACAVAFWALDAWLRLGDPASGEAGTRRVQIIAGFAAGVALLAGLAAWAVELRREGGRRAPFAACVGAYAGGAVATAAVPLVLVSGANVPSALLAALLLSPVVVPMGPLSGQGPLWYAWFAPALALVGGVVGWFLASSQELR